MKKEKRTWKTYQWRELFPYHCRMWGTEAVEAGWRHDFAHLGPNPANKNGFSSWGLRILHFALHTV